MGNSRLNGISVRIPQTAFLKTRSMQYTTEFSAYITVGAALLILPRLCLSAHET
jgi:hypothetical protein